MPWAKNGQELPCLICGTVTYRRASQIKRGIGKTCGNPECRSAFFSGERNPFWGRNHDADTLAKIKANRPKQPRNGKKWGVEKGFKHSPESRAAMAEAQRRIWAENRDKRLASLRRGSDHPNSKTADERRYRKNFTPLQRREWIGDQCKWCHSTEHLTLDHVIPIFDGGTNERTNAQTLCHKCNLWKLNFVDRPRFLAGLGSEGGRS